VGKFSEQRKLVVEDDSEPLQHTLAAFGDVGIPKSELQPRDAGDIPDDVEVALTDGGESDAGRRVAYHSGRLWALAPPGAGVPASWQQRLEITSFTFMLN